MQRGILTIVDCNMNTISVLRGIAAVGVTTFEGNPHGNSKAGLAALSKKLRSRGGFVTGGALSLMNRHKHKHAGENKTKTKA